MAAHRQTGDNTVRGDVDTQTKIEELTSMGKDLLEKFAHEPAAENRSELQKNVQKVMSEAVLEISGTVKTLMGEVEALEKADFEMAQKLKELSGECAELRQLYQQDQEITQNVMKAQLAFETRNAIIDKVLTGLVDPDAFITCVKDLEKAIRVEPDYDDVFKTEEYRKLAESRWEQLKLEFGWTGRHSRYIQNLIDEYYVPLIKPKIDEILKIIKEGLADGSFEVHVKEVEIFTELIKMYETLHDCS